jgi:hypothetical protein
MNIGGLAVGALKRRAALYKNVVDRAICEYGNDSISEFARRLSDVAGVTISKQTVANWRRRGQFSREMIVAVHRLTRIPMAELVDGMQ